MVGREGEPAASTLSQSLTALGLRMGRLKTGTPPRVLRDTVDFSKLAPQPGDQPPLPFSHRTARIEQPQVFCHLTYTSEATHDVIRANLDRSPLYGGVIEGIGPRYCPSIEDKVVRFPDKTRHQIFIEPEGIDHPELYMNGISTSLPVDAQLAIVASLPGFEHATMARPGYAVEYDFFPPDQIQRTMESKSIENLYFAGQVNGTSGYEEAAAQGFVAGVNAVLKQRGEAPFVPARDEAYIGVMIDDLTTKDIDEPYRMFTSRAEFRLTLRQDNADERLMATGYRLGLIGARHSSTCNRASSARACASSICSRRTFHTRREIAASKRLGSSRFVTVRRCVRCFAARVCTSRTCVSSVRSQPNPRSMTRSSVPSSMKAMWSARSDRRERCATTSRARFHATCRSTWCRGSARKRARSWR
jgi:glucose-inhibited division protein A